MSPDQAAVDRAAEGLPSWLAQRRKEALRVYEALGMPSEKEEIWRYLDLDLDLSGWAEPEAATIPSHDSELLESLGTLAGRAHLVDGTAVEAESDLPGVQLDSLRDAVGENGGWVKDHIGSLISYPDDKFSAAHAAFGRDGVVLRVDRGTVLDAPLYIEVGAAADGVLSFPYIAIRIEDGAEASVVLDYRSPHDIGALVVPHLEVTTGANAHLKLSIVQDWGYRTTAIGRGKIEVGRDSTLGLGEVGLGGALSRLHLTVDLDGRGSAARVVGAYFGEQSQTLDYRYFMRHVAPNTRSDMFLKGAVEDEATSVFTGMIRIEEEAQRTDAFQTNRNLILSENASAQSVPNLEILANDVKCGHGSTVGPLDQEQRYYLMSRGLSRARADRLQVRGFFEEAIARLPETSLVPPIRDRINRKFVAAQKAGRV